MLYSPPRRRRRGIVLLLVLAFLTLFAVVGISFVLYASAAANSSRYFRESETEARPEVDPELLLNYFLGQLIFDVPDDEAGVYSSLRGHSLARNMYGANYDVNDLGTYRFQRDGQWINNVPFNGTGRLHTVPSQGSFQIGEYNNPYGIDDYDLINYRFFPNDGFLRDPERYGAVQLDGTYVGWRTAPNNHMLLPGPYRGGFNAPYTYPDANNLFLGAVKAGPLHIQQDGGNTGDFPEGTLLMPSFFRPWLFRPNDPDHPYRGPTLDPANPYWTNADGKYRILRPRPIDQVLPGQTAFPYPEDEGGDVKNLIGAPGYYDNVTNRLYNNDSMWLDLGFPVMTGPDGRKFKPLFAPLVVDLDNRVNLNVHGNLRGLNNQDHASNQGWGPWEVNPAKVLDHPSNEWRQIFAGAPGRDGKYGPYAPGLPSLPWSGRPNNMADALGPIRSYAPADYDGSQEMSNGAPSEQLHIPDAFFYPTSCFPTVPLGFADTDQSQQAELVAHPSLYTIYGPYLPNRAFSLSNMEALLRYGDTGSGGLTSDLFHLCPLNFGDPNYPANATKRRGLVTTHSFDIDRPGISPYFWQQADRNAVNRLVVDNYNPSYGPQPYGLALPFPPLSLASGPGHEFGNDYRTAAALTALRRIDLNRHLPEYPEPGPDGLYPAAALEQFQVAQAARQYMAQEIFTVLWHVTGARNPGDFMRAPSSTDMPGQQEYNALRDLAQLAVNIVDFIDDDDVMTPFSWRPGEWVFGTEMPKILINEVYAEKPTDNARLANFWVELFNPLPNDASLPNSGTVNLHGYQLLITGRNGSIRDPANVTGDPDRRAPDLGRFIATDVIPPSNRGSGHIGYSVIGPPPPDELPRPDIFKGLFGPTASPTVMLRRLACPGLPPQPNPNLRLFNPPVTVDYMEEIHVNTLSDPPQGFSTVRPQPFAGDVGHNIAELRPFLTGGRQHSLGQPNLNRAPKYDWYFHPDRKLISVMELLTVSAFKPHELTQQFLKSDILCNHRARWFDDDLNGSDFPSHRLHRALEFFTVHSPMLAMMKPAPSIIVTVPIQQDPAGQSQTVVPSALSGRSVSGGTWEIREQQSLLIRDLNNPDDLTSEEVVWVQALAPDANGQPGFTAHFWRNHPNGVNITPLTISDRVPGKININTIWDRETFLALCDPYDPQRSNNFGMQEASSVFDSLMASRSPKGIPDKDDHPFCGLASGNTLGDSPWFATRGLDDTFLRSSPDDMSARRLFEIDNPNHPYLRYELMTKIFNNVTVRSNVFAVWLTVGFFEAYDTDPATGQPLRPVRLGAELHRAEGRQVRHRMFAIIDRSVLTANPGPQPSFNIRDRYNSDYSTGPVVPYYSIID